MRKAKQTGNMGRESGVIKGGGREGHSRRERSQRLHPGDLKDNTCVGDM